MNRITNNKFSELIGVAFDIIPPGISANLKGVHFLTGTDPLYAGLFNYEVTDDGRSYHESWCVAHQKHQLLSGTDCTTTIVMPNVEPKGYPLRLLPLLVVHELGHVLDEITGFAYDVLPVTEYAETNRHEAFAEGFVCWLSPLYEEYYSFKKPIDDETRYIFDNLVSTFR